jgi:hypothetical protein
MKIYRSDVYSKNENCQNQSIKPEYQGREDILLNEIERLKMENMELRCCENCDGLDEEGYCEKFMRIDSYAVMKCIDNNLAHWKKRNNS